MEQKRIDQKFKALIRKAESFNKRLFEIRKLCQTSDIYLDKSSTLISLPENVEPICCSLYENRLTAWQSNENGRSDWQVTIERDEDGEEYFEGAYEFVSDIDYMHKCINNGLRFWQSEDPDRFLEEDEE